MEDINERTLSHARAEGPHGLAASATRVLIVDDSHFDCMSIERQCRRTDLFVSVDTASDIDAMRAAMDAREYDVIFVD